MASISGCIVLDVLGTHLARLRGETVLKTTLDEAKGLPCTSFLDPSVAITAMIPSLVIPVKPLRAFGGKERFGAE